MQQKIIIVGAGIAGLATGISLKKLGFKIKVYESKDEIIGIGAGLGLASNAMKAFRYLELDKGIFSFGTKIKETHILDQKGETITVADTTLISSLEDNNYAVHRKELLHYLYAQLDPKEVISQKKALKFTQINKKVYIEFKDGSSDTADFLIASDGVGSTIRQRLIPNSKPRFAGYTCFRAITKNNELELKNCSEVWGNMGRFGYVSLPNNLIYWYACINKKNERKYTLEDLKQNFESYYHLVSEILNQTVESEIIQNDIIDIKPIKKFAHNRILLIGDAAHATTPNMGQGACMAIEDVAVLIHELKKENDVRTAFKTFERKRVKRTKYIIDTSRRIGAIAQIENPFLTQFRNQTFRWIPKSFIKKQMKILLETDIFNP